MRLKATIEIEGIVWLLGEGAEPKSTGISLRSNGSLSNPMDLYVDGVLRGVGIVAQQDVEYYWSAGTSPDALLPTRTVLNCILDL